MKAYLLILIIIGISQKPRILCYWSMHSKFNDPWISSATSKTHFLKINQNFHLCDSRAAPACSSPRYDPLYKARLFINLILPKFNENCNTGRDLSVDDWFAKPEFYVPAEPMKWGIKVWELCEADTGFGLNFDTYTGHHSRLDTCQPWT